MKPAIKSIIAVAVIFVFSIITLLSVYGQETTSSSITDLIQTTTEKIKNMASEVTNNSTGIITPDEGKNILNQLRETAKRTALGGADVLSNFSGEIKEGLN